MAIVLKDRVKETTATTGTSDFVLGGSSSGYQTFSVIGANNYTYYCCFDQATGDWEVGYGQYTTTAGGTLVRSAILSNSAATTSKINFAAGPKDVFITYPAEKAIYEEQSGNVLIDGGPITVVGAGVTGYTTFSAALGEMYGNVNSFAQLYARNLNDGAEASADMIVYRDNTVTDGANFMDMGINSSNFSSATWPIFSPSSMYLYGDGGEMFIGSGTDDVIIFTGGVDVTDEAARFDKTTKNLTLAAGLNVGAAMDVTGAATFGSTVLLSANPTTALQAATKEYVDNAASTGIHIHDPVATETGAALSAVYTQGGTTFNITDITGGNTVVTSTAHGLSVNNQIWLYSTAGNGLVINTPYFVYATPTSTSLQLSTTYGGALLTGLTNASGLSYATRANSGVGAYLEASANASLPVSGVTVGSRVLVYQQSTGYWNGVYTVTSLGSGASKWKLTRAADANYYSPADTSGLSEGDYFLVQSNSESYVLTTPGAIIIGYTSITYTLFASVPTYTGGTNINVAGGVISLTGTVAATNGGTGTSTVAVGDMLYGSATNTWSKLPIGAIYKPLVVDSAGIPSWNALALDQSGTVSGSLPAINGGTGQNAYATGDMLYSDATNSIAKLSGNTTTTKKFLGQTGTGTSSAAPVWQQPAASDITGLAASATTDTTNASNISSGTLPALRLSGSYTGITGVGTLTAGTWNGSTIGPTYGGTGQSSYAVGDLLYASTTTALSKLADVAVGNALISGGVSVAPSWGKIGLATHVSGTLPIANGGTGATATAYCSLTTNVTGTLPATNGGSGQSSYAVGDLLYADTTTSLAKLADVATGNALISGGVGVAPSYGKIGLTTHVSGTLPVANGGTGVTSSTGSGSVVLSTSPTLVTPALGTPASGNLANCTFPTLNQNTTGTAAGLSVTLATTSGGTGLTSFTSSGVLYASSTSALATGTALRFDGTNFLIGQTGTASALLTVGGSSSGQGIGWGSTAANYANIWAAYSSGDLVLGGTVYGTSATSDGYLSSYGGGAAARAAIRVGAFDGTVRFLTAASATVARGTAVSMTERVQITNAGTLQANGTIQAAGNGIYALGQIRATGWYNAPTGSSYTGLGTEIGVSGGQGYIYCYNRDTSAYGTLNIGASGANLQVSGTTVNVNTGTLQQGGSQVLTAANYTSYSPSLTGSGASGTWSINVTGSAGSATTATTASAVAPTATNEVNCGGSYAGGGTLYFNYNDGGSYTNLSIYNGGTSLAQVTASQFNGPLNGNASTATSATSATSATNVSGGTVQGSYIGVQNTSGSSGYGISLYNGATAGQPQYGLMFAQTASYGTYGGVSADWATYFTMDATANRGWIFRDTTNGNKASISNTGTATFAGNVTANSDETLKTNWRNLPADFVEQLAKVKHGTYDRTDQELTQDGVSAQSLQPVLPNSVLKGGDGKFAVNYGGAAMVSAVQLAQRVVEQDKRIAALEELVAKLTQGGSK